MENIKSRLELLESDLKNLDKMVKKHGTYGTPEEWNHILKEARKIEEFAIAQITIQKHQIKP